MPTIAIVGAGPGMGMAIGRTFATHGFDVALLARSPEKLDGYVADLVAEGVTAAGYTADVMDRDSLTAALEAAGADLGGIDVLEYSPAARYPSPGFTMASPSVATVSEFQSEIELNLYGAVAAARTVLPRMREVGTGTLLFTTGAGSIDPVPTLGNINAAHAALRNWVLNLHKELAGSGIQAAHVAIGAWIGAAGPSGAKPVTADQIAPLYWELHTSRDEVERVFRAAPFEAGSGDAPGVR